jgi:tRNA A-37 threonylcarbamoyl transferase component Bud32
MPNIIGQTLAQRYRVDEFVGRGGMAEVYKVWDSTRAVYLAMKLLREDLAEDKIFLRRFKREGATLGKLQHPNIVRFYGLEQDGELAFMLMDFVDGISLRKEIFRQSGPFPAQRVQQVTHAICSALHYAHQMGMVHCDMKPGNVMIHRSGAILVADFGIARMTDAATATMVGMGTPAYMAPELVRGQDPSPQTDVYALGVMLFEMFTGGERPFTGDHAQTTGSTSEKVRWEQVNLKPPSPSRWNPSLSPQIEAMILKCMEKDRRKRYRSVLDVRNALDAALLPAGAPVAAPAAAPPPPAAPPAAPPQPVPAGWVSTRAEDLPPEVIAAQVAQAAATAVPSAIAEAPAAAPAKAPARQPAGAKKDGAAPKPGWGFWLGWTLLTPLAGFLAGLPMGSFYSAMGYGVAAFLAFNLFVAVLVSFAQWILLRKYIPKAGFWILASGASSLISVLVFQLLPGGIGFVGGYFISGAIQGFFQWLVLRLHVRRAGWWMVAVPILGGFESWLIYDQGSPYAALILIPAMLGAVITLILRQGLEPSPA